MKILSVVEMREVETQADAGGLSFAQMMLNAGRAAAQIILARIRLPESAATDSSVRRPNDPARIVVLAGPGNNGGDGLVCAAALSELAEQAGLPLVVQVYLLKPRPEDDPVVAMVRARSLFVADAVNDMRLRVLRQMIARAGVVVDGLLGTGTSRPIVGVLRDILSEVRANRPPLVVALDGATGMDYDTGGLDAAAVPADLTVTFHAPKRGHYCFPAAGARGQLVIAPIGIADPPGGQVFLADGDWVRARLPARRPDANKGTHGRVLVVGGCSDYSGAPALAALAAYRIGAGLVTATVPPAVQPSVASACFEVTYAAPPGSEGILTPAALPRVQAWIAGARDRSALLIGPGLGQAPATGEFLAELVHLLRRTPSPKLVLDADALNLLAAAEDWYGALPAGCVLTPHPGEMARLCASSVQEVQSDRIGQAIARAGQWQQVVLLKGAYTVVASPDGRAAVIPFANPAMAVAGMGDVLAGVIAGFLAQGLSPFEAAACGAYAHAEAGERWQAQHGQAGLLASDLLPLLPDVLRSLRG